MAFIPKSEFLREITDRGFLHQCTDLEGLDALLATKPPIVAYSGFDCTAPSLHVGSLIQIMLLRWFQKCGHKPIVLLGGATTKVGDPSGKDEARKVLADEEISRNMESIRGVFSKFISFGMGATDADIVNNDEWLSNLNMIHFLQTHGRHFSVNRMLSMDSVKLRLDREQPLSFLEFTYMIMQAYDFVELHKRSGCRLQFGGSDQWGNIVSGVELQRRLAAAGEASPGELYGLTTPLLVTAEGTKMGKTADGAVWLDSNMTTPYSFWQFWRNTADADVGRFLRLFTDLSLVEIKTLESLKGAEINEAKKVLATEATALCHGRKAAEEAAETARKTFEEGAAGEALPEVTIDRAKLEAGVPAFELFKLAGLAESGGEARRLIKGGGAKVNDQPVGDENQKIDASALGSQGFIKLSAGKKRHARVLVK